MNLKNIFQKYQNLFFYIAAAAFILIGLYLRIKPIFIRPITFDEGYTLLRLINKPNIYEMIASDKSVPPLQYLLVKFVSKFSTNIIYCRFISITFSLFSSLLIVFWLKKFSKGLALLVTIFMSFSIIQIYYAWEAYVYSQLFFLSLVSIYTLYVSINIKNQKQKIFYLIIYVLSSLCAFFTHYSFIWTIFAEIFVVLVISFQKIHLKKNLDFLVIGFLSLLLIALSFYLPIFLNIFDGALMNISWMKKPSFFYFGLISKQLFGIQNLGEDISNTEITILGFLVLFIIIISFYLSTSKKINIINNSEKNIILYNLAILVANIFIPFFLSFFLKSSIYGARTIIIASFSVAVIISFLLVILVRIHVFNLLLVIIVCFFIVRTEIKNNPIQELLIHRTDLFKQYVGLLRSVDDQNNKKFLFLDFTAKDHLDTEKIFRNVVFDYYWFGHDNEKRLPDYTLIGKDNFVLYKDDEFWAMIVAADSNIDSDVDEICNNITEKHEFMGYEKVYLFRCN